MTSFHCNWDETKLYTGDNHYYLHIIFIVPRPVYMNFGEILDKQLCYCYENSNCAPNLTIEHLMVSVSNSYWNTTPSSASIQNFTAPTFTFQILAVIASGNNGYDLTRVNSTYIDCACKEIYHLTGFIAYCMVINPFSGSMCHNQSDSTLCNLTLGVVCKPIPGL